MFTLENVFDKRVEFENACKGKRACEPEFNRLVSAKTKAEFVQVIYDNINWVYREVTRFGLKYDYVGYFYEGFARVKNGGDKWGFIDTKFKEICEIKYDAVGYFNEGFACVRIGDKYGFIDGNGKEVYEKL